MTRKPVPGIVTIISSPRTSTVRAFDRRPIIASLAWEAPHRELDPRPAPWRARPMPPKRRASRHQSCAFDRHQRRQTSSPRRSPTPPRSPAARRGPSRASWISAGDRPAWWGSQPPNAPISALSLSCCWSPFSMFRYLVVTLSEPFAGECLLFLPIFGSLIVDQSEVACDLSWRSPRSLLR